MTAVLVAGVGVAGGLGAVARFVVDSAVTARRPSPFPVAVLLINVTGSLLLGLLTGLVLYDGVADGWRLVLGTGFCGGFTTFSTASVGGVRLAGAGRPLLAASYVLGTLGLSTTAAVVGLALSRV